MKNGDYKLFSNDYQVKLMMDNKAKIPTHSPFHSAKEDDWEKIINFDAMVEEGVIAQEDLDLIQYAETAEQAWNLILEDYTRKEYQNSHHD